MEREPSGDANRGTVLPPAARKRKVQPKESEPGAGVVLSGDVLRLEMEAKTLDPRVPAGMAIQANQLYAGIKNIDVRNDADYRSLGELTRIVKRVRAEVDDYFKETIFRTHKAHESALADRDRAIKQLSLEEAEFLAKAKLKLYHKVHPEAPRLEGISYPDDWRVEVIDESKIPREYLKPDLQKIHDVIVSMRDVTDVIPGVRAVKKTKVTVRR